MLVIVYSFAAVIVSVVIDYDKCKKIYYFKTVYEQHDELRQLKRHKSKSQSTNIMH